MSCLVDWVGRPTLDMAALGSGQWSQLEESLSDEFISVQMARVFLKITRSCDSSHLVSSCLRPKVTVQAQLEFQHSIIPSKEIPGLISFRQAG